MTAKIFRPQKSATQSGAGRSKRWMLVYAQETPRVIEPLMGWTGSNDMKSQLRLSFDSKEEAVAYAERNGVAYEVIEPTPITPQRKVAYSDNFKPGKIGQWTH